MKRRSFLQLLAADAALPVSSRLASAASPYQVGIGNTTDPYQATLRAVAACGQWPAASMSGKTVMIKPNLVAPEVSTTGITTDPQVVRALVDLALQAGAAQVLIVEGGVGAPPADFEACGYSFFGTYDPRVQLMDFGAQPVSLVRVPNGLTYFALHVPTPAVQPNLVFISAGKMKTHVEAVATLSMKNLFALLSPSKYVGPPGTPPRQDCHARGVHEVIVDINLLRPISFAVIDGIWGMEGEGPVHGAPVPRNLVLAGLNPVAVDRVALQVMEIQQTVPYLAYAATKGLGPASVNSVAVLGDSYSPLAFLPAQTPPVVWRPTPVPNQISVSAGPLTTIYYRIPAACPVRVAIIRDSDVTPGVTLVRTLQNWTPMQAGTWSLPWNGLNDSGAMVAPGVYLAHIMGNSSAGLGHATNWIVVNA